jgi:hypothetical protein
MYQQIYALCQQQAAGAGGGIAKNGQFLARLRGREVILPINKAIKRSG